MPPKEDKKENREQDNHPRIPGQAIQHEDREEFTKEIAHKEGICPERVQWRMDRIAQKANGKIRSLSYFKAAFPDFLQREQYELIQHLTQYGTRVSRQVPAFGIPDLIEELKCEAARIGFDYYADVVSTALRNLKRGVPVDSGE